VNDHAIQKEEHHPSSEGEKYNCLPAYFVIGGFIYPQHRKEVTMTTEKKVQVGIIGLGMGRFHLEVLKKNAPGMKPCHLLVQRWPDTFTIA
jgi:hypothetical protein